MSKDAGGPDYSREFQEMQRAIAEQRRENAEMRRELDNLTQTTTFQNVVEQGFERITTQLEPLRDLNARREYPSVADMTKFVTIQNAIAHHKWRGSKFEADLPEYSDYCNRSSLS